MHITIMRGPHTMSMVDEVVVAAEGVQTIFLELIGTPESKKRITFALNRIVTDEPYAKNDSVTQWREEFPYAELAYRLRHQTPLFLLVDLSRTDAESTEVSTIDYVAPATLHDTLLSVTSSDIRDFYEKLEKGLDQIQQTYIARDRLIAEQVHRFIQNSQTNSSLNSDHMLLVQGYLHLSKRYLQRLEPDLKIDTVFYNMQELKVAQRIPESQLLLYKRMHPDEHIPQEVIDRAALIEMSYVAEIETTGVQADDPANPTMVINHSQDAAFAKLKHRFDAMSDDACHALCERLLAHIVDNQNESSSDLFAGIKSMLI